MVVGYVNVECIVDCMRVEYMVGYMSIVVAGGLTEFAYLL